MLSATPPSSSSSSSSCWIGLECGWSGVSKDPSRAVAFDRSRLSAQRILLSGPYGDDVAFIEQSQEQILLGQSLSSLLCSARCQWCVVVVVVAVQVCLMV